ncbi:hypothetical protein HZY88_09085 [Aerococcaceae bacterium DSM 111176]|nr:hypothetical protein [Aerococcaceae bacterium DSM 111176]
MKKFILSMLVGLTVFTSGNIIQAQDDFLVDEEAAKVFENENLINTRNFSENSESSVEFEGESVIVEVQNENGGLLVDASTLEPRTDYVMTFKYKKIDGYLNSFGGHTDGIWQDNTVYLDGEENGEFTDNKSAFKSDDTEVHEVIIEFTTPRDSSPNSRLIIQPNRGDFDTVTVEITDFFLVEADVFEEEVDLD